MSRDRWESDKDIAIRFLKLFGHPEAHVLRPSGPHPDVIWDSPLGLIGLELTRVASEQGLIQREVLRQRALEHATRLAGNLGVEDLGVWVHWHNGAPSPRQPTTRIAQDLVEIVRAHLPRPGHTLTLGTDCDFDQELEHRIFDRIRIDRSVAHGAICFYSGYSAWGRDMTADHLSDIIVRKSAKDRTGMPLLAEHWLVIHGGDGQLSSYMEPLPPALLVTYPSAFDRIFLAFLSQARLWSIATAPLQLGA